MQEKMNVPLFSYDVKSQQPDINCQKGNICYVGEVIVGANSPEITINKERIKEMAINGKEIVSTSDLTVNGVLGLMNYVDDLLKQEALNNKNQWERTYRILDSEYQARKEYTNLK